jgi:hypothetical protein
MQVLKHSSYHLDGATIVKRGVIDIDEKLTQSVEFTLFVMQPPAAQDKSRQEIERLKEAIENGVRLPPIVVEDMGDYIHVCDGNHRVIALYEEGITHHNAIFVRRRH